MRKVKGKWGWFASFGFFAMASLLAIVGCGPIRVKLGTRVSLPKLPVTTMEVAQYKHPGIGPGEKSSLVATLTQPDGTVLVSEGKGKGKVQWSDLAVVASVVTVNKSGVITLPRDPRVSSGKTGHVEVTIPSHPGVSADLDIPLRYDYAFVAAYAGSSGNNGLDGNAGQDGSDGLPGSFDPDNPTAGGNGSDGTNGSDGGNGGDGDNGPALSVRATLQSGVKPLLQIGITTAGHKEHYYLVDPQGGSLAVTSAGGAGGRGGTGGRAGRGGSGGPGSPSGSSGHDGLAGHDGSSGSDGRGGSIALLYDPQVKQWLGAIKLSNPGGPAPVLAEGAVAPLW